MGQNICKANRLSASQEIPHIFTEPDSSLPHLQLPTTSPYPKLDRSSQCHFIPIPEDPS
jgi:hypothetical protein